MEVSWPRIVSVIDGARDFGKCSRWGGRLNQMFLTKTLRNLWRAKCSSPLIANSLTPAGSNTVLVLTSGPHSVMSPDSGNMIIMFHFLPSLTAHVRDVPFFRYCFSFLHLRVCVCVECICIHAQCMYICVYTLWFICVYTHTYRCTICTHMYVTVKFFSFDYFTRNVIL